MTDGDPTIRPKYMPGPAKGSSRVVVGTGKTRRELLLEAGFALAHELKRPTLENVAARQPLLSKGYLKAYSRLLEPCRETYRSLVQIGRGSSPAGSPPEPVGDGPVLPDFANVALLAERRAARAHEDFTTERAAHAATKEKLRQAEAVIDRLLLGFATED